MQFNFVGNLIRASGEVVVGCGMAIDSNVFCSDIFVKAAWQQAIILGIACCPQKGIGYLSVTVKHDCLIYLHLILPGDQVVVGLECAGPVAIVIQNCPTCHRSA